MNDNSTFYISDTNDLENSSNHQLRILCNQRANKLPVKINPKSPAIGITEMYSRDTAARLNAPGRFVDPNYQASIDPQFREIVIVERASPLEHVFAQAGIFRMFAQAKPKFFPFKPNIVTQFSSDLFSRWGAVTSIRFPVFNHQMMNDIVFTNADMFHHRDYLCYFKEKIIVGMRPMAFKGLAMTFNVTFQQFTKSFFWDDKDIYEVPVGEPTLYEIGDDYLLDVRNVDVYKTIGDRPVHQAQWELVTANRLQNMITPAVLDVSGVEYILPPVKVDLETKQYCPIDPMKNGRYRASVEFEEIRKKEFPDTYVPSQIKETRPREEEYQEISAAYATEPVENIITSDDLLMSNYNFSKKPSYPVAYLRDGNTGEFEGIRNESQYDPGVELEGPTHNLRYVHTYVDRRYRIGLFNAYRSSSGRHEPGKRFEVIEPRNRPIRVYDSRGGVLSNVPIRNCQLVWLKMGVGNDYSQYSYMKIKNHYAMYCHFGGTS